MQRNTIQDLKRIRSIFFSFNLWERPARQTLSNAFSASIETTWHWVSPSAYFTTVSLKVNNACVVVIDRLKPNWFLCVRCNSGILFIRILSKIWERVLETEIGLRFPTSSEDFPWSLIIGRIIDTLKSVGITPCLKMYWKNRNRHSFTFVVKQKVIQIPLQNDTLPAWLLTSPLQENDN